MSYILQKLNKKHIAKDYHKKKVSFHCTEQSAKLLCMNVRGLNTERKERYVQDISNSEQIGIMLLSKPDK